MKTLLKHPLSPDSKTKYSMAETTANTKSTSRLKNKKHANASIYNVSESILSSQFLRDSGLRDMDARHPLQSTPSKANIYNERILSSSKKSSAPSLIKQRLADLEHSLYLKEKEIETLQESKLVISNKIDQALNFIDQNGYVRNLVGQRNGQIKSLNSQIQETVIELNEMRNSVKQTRANSQSHPPGSGQLAGGGGGSGGSQFNNASSHNLHHRKSSSKGSSLGLKESFQQHMLNVIRSQNSQKVSNSERFKMYSEQSPRISLVSPNSSKRMSTQRLFERHMTEVINQQTTQRMLRPQERVRSLEIDPNNMSEYYGNQRSGLASPKSPTSNKPLTANSLKTSPRMTNLRTPQSDKTPTTQVGFKAEAQQYQYSGHKIQHPLRLQKKKISIKPRTKKTIDQLITEHQDVFQKEEPKYINDGFNDLLTKFVKVVNGYQHETNRLMSRNLELINRFKKYAQTTNEEKVLRNSTKANQGPPLHQEDLE